MRKQIIFSTALVFFIAMPVVAQQEKPYPADATTAVEVGKPNVPDVPPAADECFDAKALHIRAVGQQALLDQFKNDVNARMNASGPQDRNCGTVQGLSNKLEFLCASKLDGNGNPDMKHFDFTPFTEALLALQQNNQTLELRVEVSKHKKEECVPGACVKVICSINGQVRSLPNCQTCP